MKPTMPGGTGVVPAWMLLATIFITGTVVMMLEVVGTRVVGPFFGVGIYVWSALITVTLLALSGGYWLGGRWADHKQRPEYLYLAIAAAAVLTFLIPAWRNPVLTFASRFGVRLGVLAGSALLFGGPLFLLGMVSPYVTRLYTRQVEKIGSRVGLLFAVSTLGSFLGTLAMGFYLIPNFRISHILLALGFALLLPALVYFLLLRSRRWPMFAGIMLLCGFSVALFPEAPAAQRITNEVAIIGRATSFYGEIKVLEIADGKRLLLVDGVTQSGDDFKTHHNTPPYIGDLDQLLAHYQPRARRVLVLGLGGGNIVHALLERKIAVDVAEIDRKMVEVATAFFGIDPKQVGITLDDGRHFIRNSRVQYDVVVMNTFNGESSPSHLLTQEFFQEAKQRLAPGGVLALNFVGYVQGPQQAGTLAVYATLRSAFAWCHAYFRGPQDRFSNVLFLAGDGKIPPETQEPAWQELRSTRADRPEWKNGVVCTDDYNPMDFLNRAVYQRWRQMVIDTIGPFILLN